MSKSTIQAGLFGFGTVGQGIYDLLENATEPPIAIDKIVVKSRDKQRSLPTEHFAYDRNLILQNPSIDLVIELIDDAEEAWEIAKATLQNGKSLVTANKKMVALHLADLYELQQKNEGIVLYEAAACGAIPAVQTVDQYLARDEINSISGIFNGTSNYILSQVSSGASFDQALSEAQEQGFAEADPTLDVDGYDAAFKLSILAAHAFGQYLPPLEIPRAGIRQAGVAEYLFGSSHDYQLKLVAHAECTDGNASGYVLPAFVHDSNPLYHVHGEDNSLLAHARAAGALQINGKGAGSFPTAQAVRADIDRWIQSTRYQYPLGLQTAVESTMDVRIPLYARAKDANTLKRIPFESVFETTQTNDYAYRIGEVNYNELARIAHENSDLFIALLPQEYEVKGNRSIKRKQLIEVE